MDKLDQDFILFLSFAFDCLEKLKHPNQLEICKLWLDKLCAEHYITISAKQTRNLYLNKLVLNIQDGKFNAEFLDPPPSGHGFLPFCQNISMCHKTKLCDPTAPVPGCEPVNHDMDMSNYFHMSQNRRTYVATKPICNGVMSYVAVTMGGETPQWVNKDGQPLPFPATNKVLKVVTADPAVQTVFLNQGRRYLNEESARERKKKVLARRKPQEDRTKLIHFYDEILRRIDVEMEDLTGKTCVENKDPFIEQLTNKLQNTVVSQSTDTVQIINKAVGKRRVLLAMLRSNIESQKKNIFEKREMILNKIEKAIEREEKEIQNETDFQFIKPQERVSSDEADYKSTIWGTILNEQMHPKHVCLLKRKYCFQLVTVLQSLLKEDKVKIINQAQLLARDIEEQMTRDLQSEIQKGLLRFSNARQEWIKIQNVLKDIDRTRMEIMKEKMECQCNTSTGCNTKINLLDTCAQVANMKLKLECVNKRNEDLGKNIKIIHGKIHQVNEQSIASHDEINCEYEQLKFCVTEKLNEIREQEFAIAKFKEYK